MNWQQVLISLLCTLGGLIIADIYAHFKSNGKKFVNRKKEENKAEVKEVVEEVIDPLKTDIRNINSKIDHIQQKDLEILKKGQRDLIRNQLNKIYDKSTVYKTKESITVESELFSSYKNLEGNHGTDARHKEFEELPTEEEFKLEHPEDYEKICEKKNK